MELQIIQNKIYEIRGQKVMLDFDLAELYATETRLLKRAVRRNIDRFPIDFMFELSTEEYCLSICFRPKVPHLHRTNRLQKNLSFRQVQ